VTGGGATRPRRRAAPAVAIAGILCLTVGGCEAGAPDPSSGGAAADEPAVVTVPVSAGGGPERSTLSLADVAGAPSWPVPTEAPERFGFGVDAAAERVARWDRDVRPDGAGLPPGRGTVAEGERVFLEQCSACHGPTGTEGPNDALVGREPREGFPFGADRGAGPRTVGNYWPYATTLFDYITRAMPQTAPGSLTADQTYAVIAWLLARNEIVGEDAVLDAATLAAVRMPAAERFVPDDRRGGPEVR